jgi:hypothetical protein
VTDDINAFVAAVAAQPSGGVVYIPPGKYRLGSQLSIKRRVSLVGAGPDQAFIIQDWAAADVKLIEYAGAVLNSSVRSSTRLASIPTQAFRGSNVLNVQVRRMTCRCCCTTKPKLQGHTETERPLLSFRVTMPRSRETVLYLQLGAGSL